MGRPTPDLLPWEKVAVLLDLPFSATSARSTGCGMSHRRAGGEKVELPAAGVEPVRTCVGCRQRCGKSALLRVVAVQVDGAYVAQADPRSRMPGRGAYVHPSLECVDLAVRRGAFTRALRISGTADLATLRHDVEAG